MKKQEKQYLIYGGLALLGVGGYLYYTKMAYPQTSEVDSIVEDLIIPLKSATYMDGNESSFVASLVKKKGKCKLANYGPIVERTTKENSRLLNEAMVELKVKNDTTKLKNFVAILVNNVNSISC